MRRDGKSLEYIAKKLDRSHRALQLRWTRVLRHRVQDAPEPATTPAAMVKAEPKPSPSARMTRGAAVAVRSRRQLTFDMMHSDDVTTSDMVLHLNWLRSQVTDWDHDAYLALAQGIIRDDGAGNVAAHMGLDKDAVIARWRALTGGLPITLNLQQRLLEALRQEGVSDA